MVGYAPIFIPAVGFVSAAGAGVHRRTIAKELRINNMYM
jgi:hypothetical protein